MIAAVAARNLLARRIEVDVASHHPIIDPILPELRTALADLAPQPTTIPMISTAPARTRAGAGRRLLGRQSAQPGPLPPSHHPALPEHHTFIEISPHPVLTHAITDTLGDARRAQLTPSARCTATPTTPSPSTRSSRRPADARSTTDGRLADVPVTPWQHTRFWVADRSAISDSVASHPLLGTHIEVPSSRDHVWQADVGTAVSPWLADHKVFGQPIMPAPGSPKSPWPRQAKRWACRCRRCAINQLEVEQMLTLTTTPS